MPYYGNNYKKSKTENNKIVKRKNKVTDKRNNEIKSDLFQNVEGFFGNNLVKNMRFGSKGDTISGYIHREVRLRDNKGNEQIVSEDQFFNSGSGYKVRINDNSSESL